MMKNFGPSALWTTFLLAGALGCATHHSSPAPKAVESPPAPATMSMGDLKLDLDVRKEILPNGLRVLLLRNDQLPIFSFYTFVDVGGRYESKGTTGATHFLEHLMFKGAKKYGPGMFDSLIESVGGQTNAYTTFDSTVYYESMPSESLATIVDLEADRLQNLLLEPVAFESERQVVLEERKYRYENSPEGKLYLAMMQAVFEKTPYGGSVIGDVEDLVSLNRDHVMEFFKQYYAPNNAVVVVVGDIDLSKTMAMIKEKYGPIPASPGLVAMKKAKDDPAFFRHQGRYGREIKIYGTNDSPILSLAYPGVEAGNERSYAMDILSSILADGQSSDLTQHFVKSKNSLFNSIDASNYNLKNNGVFFLSGKLMKGVSLDKARRELTKYLERLCDDQGKIFNERNLQKTKNQYMIDFYEEVQTNAGIASFIGNRENLFGDYSTYKQELQKYAAITVEDVKKSCREVIGNNRPLAISIWNKHPNPNKAQGGKQ